MGISFEEVTVQELMKERGLINTHDYAQYYSRYSYPSLPSSTPLIENCRNCGAPPEPVCCYCGTVHDGKTYKTRNLPPPPPMSEEERKFWLDIQMGIKVTNPLYPFVLNQLSI